jgi:hypothetical protein
VPRFLVHVLFGSLGAGIFYAVMPMGIAMAINAAIPYGLDSLTGTTAIKAFVGISVATILPMSAIAVVRSGRRAFYGRTDARPALFGHAGSGLRAARTYRQRAIAALALGLVSLLVAFALAVLLSCGAIAPSATLAVLYFSLGSVLGVLAAIESNDLRRTVNLGLLSGGA